MEIIETVVVGIIRCLWELLIEIIFEGILRGIWIGIKGIYSQFKKLL